MRPGSRRRSSSATARSCSGWRYACSRHTATASASSSGSELEVERDERRRPGPIRSRDADAALERDERLGVRRAQPVEVRASLPAEVQQVLEPRGATNAVRAPLRSSSAFVATVVPW